MHVEHKYIVAQIEGQERIFVFPKVVDHDRMWECLGTIRFGGDRDWSRKLREAGSLISAGFVSHGVCHGRSETLGIDSRGTKDTLLLIGE